MRVPMACGIINGMTQRRYVAPGPRIVAVLENIRSLHNVGSIFRTADAAGVEKLYLCGITPEPFDRLGKTRSDLAKVSLGAEESVPWEHAKNVSSCLASLTRDGWAIYVLEQHRKSIDYGTTLWNGRRTMPAKLALLMGNEIGGVSPRSLRRADRIIEIPMRGKKESLNVAVAFGVAVFGIRLQAERCISRRHI